MNRAIWAALTAFFASHAAQAAEDRNEIVVRGIVPDVVESVAGSLTIISAAELDHMQPITIKEALRRAAGVQVIDEDAFGLKLNISVRGLNARRSGRTLLLEDGVPIQPAPYADPSAHYYPPLARIERIQLRKGSAQVLYGPQSIGGVVNFVTRDVPVTPIIEGSAALGTRAYRNFHAAFGLGDDRGGLRIDATHLQGGGIRDFHETGVSEIAAKGRIALGDGHALTVKAAFYEERSSLTEGGLDQARFDISPFYNPFRNDRFALDRWSGQFVHDWKIGDKLQLSTQIYFARTFRASYRQADTSIDAMTANPATGCVGAARIDYERFAALCGNKMRPRAFSFWGIEPRLRAEWSALGVPSEAIFGVRAHFETTNRRRFDGQTPNARETTPGTMMRDDNDINVAAFSAYLQNSFRLGRLRITPGVRVERIEIENRARVANFVTIDRVARATQSIVLPGIGITWVPHQNVTAFVGVHEGFAPPRPDRDFNPTAPISAVRPERSYETEVGLRVHPRAGVAIDATIFEMNLSDLIVEGPLVGARSGTFVNAGSARHRGFELAARVELGFVDLGLTYSNLFEARFLTDVDEFTRGVRENRIPYAPEHLVDFHVGYRHPSGFGAELGVNYISEQFANASNTRVASADGLIGTVPARTIARLAINHRAPRSRVQLFATIENLFDLAYISSRVDGLFAGPRRVLGLGVRIAQ